MKDEVKMAGAAVALRSALLAMVFAVRGDDWSHYLSNCDGPSFLAVARVIYGLAPRSALKLYDSRVFPGWPLAFGWMSRFGIPDQCVLVLAVALAALVPVLFYRLTRDRTLSWYLVYFPPAWLVASAYPISEAAYLAAILAGLLALKANRPALAGAVGGLLVVLRAFGIAWFGGIFLGLIAGTRRIGWAAIACALAAAVPMAGLLFLNWRLYGDVLYQLHVYGRPLVELNIPSDLAASLHNPSGHWGPPFRHLLLTPWLVHVPLWKTLYIYAHVPVVLFLAWRGCAYLLRGARGEAWETALVAGFLMNTALIVCAGPYWGFESFDRYFIWGIPGALWLARPWLGGSPRWHWILFPVSMAMALCSMAAHTAH
jgi:hypothetical protein